ncbi:MAG: hypothetical protein V4591_08145 [Bdellovibrionota bacterium]
MSDEIILHRINTHQKIDDLIEDFYPEFCTPYKRNAIFEAIKGMNEHNGNVTRGFLPLGSWVLLPAYSSTAYCHIADQDVPSTGLSYVLATSPIHGVHHVRDTQSALHQGMKALGPQKMLATSTATFDWWQEFHGNLAESPKKDTLLESSKYVIEKSGEHGASVYMATRSLDQALKKFGSASGREARQAAKQEVLSAHKQLQHELPKSVKKLVTHFADKRFTHTSHRRGLKALTSPGNAMRSATQLAGSDTLVIAGSDYTKMIKLMKHGEHIGKGFIALDIATNTFDVVEAYEKDENWKGLAFEDSAGLVFSQIGGRVFSAVGSASFTVCGPCVVVVAPALAIGGAILGDKAGHTIGKFVYKAFYE